MSSSKVKYHRKSFNETQNFMVLRGFRKSRNESPSRSTRSSHLILMGLRSWKRISGLLRRSLATGLNLCTNENIKDFFKAKVFSWPENFKSENFMYSDWSEEKFLKGRVGQKRRLCFWNKCQMKDFLLTQLASYRHVPARELIINFMTRNILLLATFSGIDCWYFNALPCLQL